MPTEKVLKQKQEYVAELTDKIQNSMAGVLVDYKGITVQQDTAMRRELREAGVEYFVVKNTMLRRAAEKLCYEGFYPFLEGTTALAISKEDPIAPAKVLSKYVKELKEDTQFAIKVGYMEGKVIDAAMVTEIGSLPSREQMMGQLVSVLIAPMRGLAVALHAIAEQTGETES